MVSGGHGGTGGAQAKLAPMVREMKALEGRRAAARGGLEQYAASNPELFRAIRARCRLPPFPPALLLPGTPPPPPLRWGAHHHRRLEVTTIQLQPMRQSVLQSLCSISACLLGGQVRRVRLPLVNMQVLAHNDLGPSKPVFICCAEKGCQTAHDRANVWLGMSRRPATAPQQINKAWQERHCKHIVHLLQAWPLIALVHFPTFVSKCPP